jgi:hypothetical protein
MGIYIYTFRKTRRNVMVEGTLTPVNEFRYAYRESRHNRPACEARSHQAAESAWDSSGDGPYRLALQGSQLWLVNRPIWYDTDDVPDIALGNVTRVGRHLTLSEQFISLDVARSMLTPASTRIPNH